MWNCVTALKYQRAKLLARLPLTGFDENKALDATKFKFGTWKLIWRWNCQQLRRTFTLKQHSSTVMTTIDLECWYSKPNGSNGPHIEAENIKININWQRRIERNGGCIWWVIRLGGFPPLGCAPFPLRFSRPKRIFHTRHRLKGGNDSAQIRLAGKIQVKTFATLILPPHYRT